MTKKEIVHLVHSIPVLTSPPLQSVLWKKAFEEYNEDIRMTKFPTLNPSAKAHYPAVASFLISKYLSDESK